MGRLSALPRQSSGSCAGPGSSGGFPRFPEALPSLNGDPFCLFFLGGIGVSIYVLSTGVPCEHAKRKKI